MVLVTFSCYYGTIKPAKKSFVTPSQSYGHNLADYLLKRYEKLFSITDTTHFYSYTACTVQKKPSLSNSRRKSVHAVLHTLSIFRKKVSVNEPY